MKITGPLAEVEVLRDDDCSVLRIRAKGDTYPTVRHFSVEQHVGEDLARILSGSVGLHPDTIVFLREKI